MDSFAMQRERMVERQIASRGVSDDRVLNALRNVPREQFVAGRLQEFAYEDAPLPIEEGQTISQPYIVALMIEAAQVEPGDRVLEVGAGSGYAAAVLGQIAAEVYAVERHESLADLAGRRMKRLGYRNVHVVHGDGTRGHPEKAPFDVILVSAGGPEAPPSLLEQLKIGGRLIIPIGDSPRTQDLVRIRRTADRGFERDDLGQVQFVPLVGSEGWSIDGAPVADRRAKRPLRARPAAEERLSSLIARSCEPIDDIEAVSLDGLLERIGGARVVLIGEATHGTSEFYRMRARITRDLIVRRGFDIVAMEADWPDMAAIDRQTRGLPVTPLRERPFSRFPTWMWRNHETRHFVEWLAKHNKTLVDPAAQASVHGLDLYSLNNSIGAVLDYLDRVDPEAAESARARYGCFSPWESDPAAYGRATLGGRMPNCEREAVSILTSLLARRMEYVQEDGDSFFDAERNTAVVRDAERYYRVMYYGSRESWNLRDRHMFDTLQAVLSHRGETSRAVVWAHNSHVGDAGATEMGTRGEINIGQLARRSFGDAAYLIGFGTDHGVVAAASNWDEPMEEMTVRPSHPDSYERLCHQSDVRAFLLPLRSPKDRLIRSELMTPRLERAIGVIYRPETEMLSHYFQASLPAQFDEYVWFDRTQAVRPIENPEIKTPETAGVAAAAETYPFGL